MNLQDAPANNVYPMPLYAWGKNDVFVGRIRRDPSVKSGLNFWCVADNLRKGAATNAVQIAEKLIEKGFLPRAYDAFCKDNIPNPRGALIYSRPDPAQSKGIRDGNRII